MRISEYLDEYLSYSVKMGSAVDHIKIVRIFNWAFSQILVIFVVMWIVFFIIWFTVDYLPTELSKVVTILWYLWLWIIIWIFFLVQAIKTFKIKKSKINWEWIKESLRVKSIEEYIKKWSPYDWGFYWFYVEVTDGDKIYRSDAYNLIMKGWIDPESNSQFRKVNGHTIKIWDMIDVYFDSDNHGWYWVDLDFLFN